MPGIGQWKACLEVFFRVLDSFSDSGIKRIINSKDKNKDNTIEKDIIDGWICKKIKIKPLLLKENNPLI